MLGIERQVPRNCDRERLGRPAAGAARGSEDVGHARVDRLGPQRGRADQHRVGGGADAPHQGPVEPAPDSRRPAADGDGAVDGRDHVDRHERPIRPALG
jgi:hypothetical protein